jgi:hypothetical protein
MGWDANLTHSVGDAARTTAMMSVVPIYLRWQEKTRGAIRSKGGSSVQGWYKGRQGGLVGRATATATPLWLHNCHASPYAWSFSSWVTFVLRIFDLITYRWGRINHDWNFDISRSVEHFKDSPLTRTRPDKSWWSISTAFTNVTFTKYCISNLHQACWLFSVFLSSNASLQSP